MKLDFEAIALYEKENAIAISYDFNAVFKVDMQTGASNYFGLIPNEELDKKRLYTKAVRVGGKVYFVPFRAEEIAVYDIKKDCIYKIPYENLIKKEKQEKSVNMRFSASVAYGKYLFILPSRYPGVLRIDTTNDSITCYDGWVNGEEYTFRKEVAVDEEILYLPSCINNQVLQFNMRSCIGKLITVGKNNNGCWSMCKKEEYFWFAPQNKGPVIRWNPKDGETVEYERYPVGFKGNNFLFTKSYTIEKDVFLIPAYANMWIKINTKSGKMQDAKVINTLNMKSTLYMFEMGDYIYLKICGECIQRVKVNKKDNKVQNFEFWIERGENQFKNDYINAVKEKRDSIKECEYVNIRDLMEYLKGKNEASL